MRNRSFSFFVGYDGANASRSPRLRFLFLCTALIWSAANVPAQEAYRDPNEDQQPAAQPAETPYRSPTELKKLPLEELVDLEITSAARRPEKLFETSSAVDVIT